MGGGNKGNTVKEGTVEGMRVGALGEYKTRLIRA